jgi:hypothetical protein
MFTVTCAGFTADQTTDGITLKINGSPGFIPEALIDKHELAHQLRRTARTVKEWLACGCPYSKIDGSIRFRQSEVERWLLQRRVRRVA